MTTTKILRIAAIMLFAHEAHASTVAAKFTIEQTLNRIHKLCWRRGNLCDSRRKMACGELCGTDYKNCMYKTLEYLLSQQPVENMQSVANTDKAIAQQKKNDNPDNHHYGC